MLFRPSHRAGFALAAGLLTSIATHAQIMQPVHESPNSYPSALPPRKGPPPPRVSFHVDVEIPIPSVVAGSPLVASGGGVRVESDTGAIDVAPAAGAIPTPAATSPAPESESSSWVVSEDGRYRVRTLPQGRVEAQKHSRSASGHWHRAWSFRVAGRTVAPPVILGERLFFGALDSQVYCVRLENGHRIWAVDLGDRLSLPLAAGRIRAPGAEGKTAEISATDFVLGVPDGGSSLVALDAYDGSRLAAYDAERQDMLVTPPLILADGRVAIGRAGYSGGGAALVVLRMEAEAEAAKSGPK